MSVSLTQVRDIFKNLETDDGGEFFTHVADDVDWTVEGTHPLAGHYHSKADFRAYLDSALVARLFEENPIPEPKKTRGAAA